MAPSTSLRRMDSSLHALQLVRALLDKIPAVPASVKWIFYTLLLLNARSLPLMWHFRVFESVIYSRLAYLFKVYIPYFFSSRANKARALDRWLHSISPIGEHPFKKVTYYHAWASLDDSDWNMHLSNSSYAKTLDACRMKGAMSMFSRFLATGGMLPLAGIHLHFIREVPILAKYEVRVSTGSWDEKWAYVMCRIVTKPAKGGKKPRTIGSSDVSSSVTPAVGTTSTSNGKIDQDMAAVRARLMPTVEKDGAILHCVSIARICFKLGRITVPPSLVFATCGFSAEPTEHGAAPYSHANPPPHMTKVKEYTSAGGKKYRDFLSGGWRTEKDRWWETALGAEVEIQRKERLADLIKLTQGMDCARDMDL